MSPRMEQIELDQLKADESRLIGAWSDMWRFSCVSDGVFGGGR